MEVALHVSRLRHALLIVCGLGFVAAAVFIAIDSSNSAGELLLAGSSFAMGIAGVSIGAKGLFDRRAHLVIDARGVMDRSWGPEPIRWSEIRGACLSSIGSNTWLCLEVVDAEPYLRRASAIKRSLARANSRLGFEPICINLSMIDADPHEVLEMVLAHVEGDAGGDEVSDE